MEITDKVLLRKMAFTGDDVLKSRIRAYEFGLIDMYEYMNKMLERAEWLVGNPATGISSSTDLACESWQKDLIKMKEQIKTIIK